jgi:hypothetical protein
VERPITPQAVDLGRPDLQRWLAPPERMGPSPIPRAGPSGPLRAQALGTHRPRPPPGLSRRICPRLGLRAYAAVTGVVQAPPVRRSARRRSHAAGSRCRPGSQPRGGQVARRPTG